jgi:RNA-directed DNA polymerase
MRKSQMMTHSVSAFSTWEDIDWNIVELQVKRLQMRIAKAIRENRYHKAQALQWMLTHSYYAKLLSKLK